MSKKKENKLKTKNVKNSNKNNSKKNSKKLSFRENLEKIKVKELILGILIFIGIIICIIILAYLTKGEKLQVLSEQTSILKGHIEHESEVRYNEVIKKAALREKLIVQLERVKNNKTKTNSTIDSLLQEGIRVDIIEFINNLKEKQILSDSDSFNPKTNAINIGRIKDEVYAFELRLKTKKQILDEQKRRDDQDKMVLIER